MTTQYYVSHLEKGNAFSDWICDQLRKANPAIIVGVYSSRKYQMEKGESMSGIEIKNDDRLAGSEDHPKPTHNLYIEVAEKASPTNKNYVRSGIFRDDNGWLYLVGNYEEAFLFSTRQLQRLFISKQWHEQHHITIRKTPTSVGFTIPRWYVLSNECPYLLQHWVFDEEKIRLHHPGQPITLKL